MDDLIFFLKEDLQDIGDITTNGLFSSETAEAVILVKEPCVLAGIEEAAQVFEIKGARIEPSYKDGDYVSDSSVIAKVSGPVRSILSAERVCLNILGRMSGIATQTKSVVDLCRTKSKTVEIAATRKTTPGFRRFEKKAVVLGGGISHRMGLYDAIMIKDNHLKLIGSVDAAIKIMRESMMDLPIEIEVENQEDAITAATFHVDVIMLDNIPAELAESLTKKIKKISPFTTVEISGGITKNNILDYAGFADRISLGMLTHTIQNIDFSLEITK